MTRRVKLIIFTVAALLTVLVAGWGLYGCVSSSYEGSDVTVYLPAGADEDAVKDSLLSSLGEKSGERVYTLIRAKGGAKPGAYGVKNGMPAWRIANMIAQGRQTPVRVTYNNVVSMDALAERVASKMQFSADEFLAAADSILPSRGYAKQTYLSAFLPDTYEFYWTDSPVRVIDRLVDYTASFWNDERLAKAAANGLTPMQVSILASIVEEESAKTDEYGKIARLYMNRLDRGMKLQADPTVKFAVGDRTIRRITRRHLSVDSPYNTYMYAGLPPGPLRMPASATLDAVLDAPANPYIYMCAKEDFSGYHNFAADYGTHQANARRYQAALDARGI